jgi:hypothetical protein
MTNYDGAVIHAAFENELLCRDPMGEMGNATKIDAHGARRITCAAQMLQISLVKQLKRAALKPLPRHGL